MTQAARDETRQGIELNENPARQPAASSDARASAAGRRPRVAVLKNDEINLFNTSRINHNAHATDVAQALESVKATAAALDRVARVTSDAGLRDNKPHLKRELNNYNYKLHLLESGSFLDLDKREQIVVARSETNQTDGVAVRLRLGATGYSEWTNELLVYLLPRFKHRNILGFLDTKEIDKLTSGNNTKGFDCVGNFVTNCISWKIDESKRRRKIEKELEELTNMPCTSKQCLENDRQLQEQQQQQQQSFADEEEEEESQQQKPEWQRVQPDNHQQVNNHHQPPPPAKRTGPKLYYSFMTNFNECITLRDYLKYGETLSWFQMVNIAKGIVNGLHFLHENVEYQNMDHDKLVSGFVTSTHGAIKKVIFIENNTGIHMVPPVTLSIIHRNLTSNNIVLRGQGLTPCIWNFGLAYINYPFQPVNHPNSINIDTREMILASPYSPPEVLEARGYLTLPALKSIDMYALGIIFWELLSQCSLPNLPDASEAEHMERTYPGVYYEPFEQEFGRQPTKAMLRYAVCRLHARPRIKNTWLLGRKTDRFVQTIQELWDHDYDARIHTSTVFNRLEGLSLSDRDARNRYACRVNKHFDLETMWPEEFHCAQAPPFPTKSAQRNMYYVED